MKKRYRFMAYVYHPHPVAITISPNNQEIIPLDGGCQLLLDFGNLSDLEIFYPGALFGA